MQNEVCRPLVPETLLWNHREEECTLLYLCCQRRKRCFSCQAPRARRCYLCCLWEEGLGAGACFLPHAVPSKAKERPGLQLHRGAVWGKQSEMQPCFCNAVPQQAPVLEIFTELALINSPDKSIQRWNRNSMTYPVHSSLLHSDCRCGSKCSYIQTGSKEH